MRNFQILGVMVTVLVSILLFGCASVSSSDRRELPTITTTQLPLMPQSIPPEERQRLEQEAMDGSIDAAKRLASDYSFFNDYEQANYWYTIGAENGDPLAMFNLWSIKMELGMSKIPNERAMFWLKRAAALGNVQAIDAIKKMESKSK